MFERSADWLADGLKGRRRRWAGGGCGEPGSHAPRCECGGPRMVPAGPWGPDGRFGCCRRCRFRGRCVGWWTDGRAQARTHSVACSVRVRCVGHGHAPAALHARLAQRADKSIRRRPRAWRRCSATCSTTCRSSRPPGPHCAARRASGTVGRRHRVGHWRRHHARKLTRHRIGQQRRQRAGQPMFTSTRPRTGFASSRPIWTRCCWLTPLRKRAIRRCRCRGQAPPGQAPGVVRNLAHTRSTTIAIPWPTPMHIVTSA